MVDLLSGDLSFRQDVIFINIFDMKTESTETQEKKLETLEEATMSVLNEMWPFDIKTRRTIKDTVAARETNVANVEKYAEQMKQLIARFPDIKMQYSKEEAKNVGISLDYSENAISAGSLVTRLFYDKYSYAPPKLPEHFGFVVDDLVETVTKMKKLNFDSDDLLSVAKQLPYFSSYHVKEVADFLKGYPIKTDSYDTINTNRKYFRDDILNIINLIPEYDELRREISKNVSSADARHQRLGEIQPRKLVNKYYKGYDDESKAEAVIRDKNDSISSSLRQIVRKMNDPELAREAKGEIDEFIGKINNILARDGQGYRLK